MRNKKKWIIYILIAVVALGWAGRAIEEQSRPAFGLIEINGPITESMPYLETIRDYEQDDSIKAVIVRLESPGGAVGPSQEVYEALKRLRGKKPVVASMSTVGASGAYYIALAADKIYALPGTMTGSIGVIMHFMDASAVLGKIGLKGETVKSGNLKDAGTPLRPMNATERHYFESLIQDVQAQFVAAVASERKLKPVRVAELADGRVYTGSQAKKLGLIDELGGYDRAVDYLKQRTGIKDPRIVEPDRDGGLAEFIAKELRSEASGLARSAVRLEYSIP